MNYTEEVYEQLRGDGSVQYKVCAAVPGKCFFGLINTTERWWLLQASDTWYMVDTEFSSFFESPEAALIKLRTCMEEKERQKASSEIIHFKRIQ